MRILDGSPESSVYFDLSFLPYGQKFSQFNVVFLGLAPTPLRGILDPPLLVQTLGYGLFCCDIEVFPLLPWKHVLLLPVS